MTRREVFPRLAMILLPLPAAALAQRGTIRAAKSADGQVTVMRLMRLVDCSILSVNEAREALGLGLHYMPGSEGRYQR